MTVNGVTTTGALRGKQTIFSNILLFKANPAEKNYVGKIYYLKIWDNDVLVRDLVPAKRLSDNSVGMYDTVEGKFYTNAGTGTFTTGSVVPSPVEPKEVQELRLPYNGNNYKFFDYIQSSGTQWIDTGKLAPLNTDIEVRFSLNSVASGAAYNGAIFGGRNAQTSRTCTLFYLASANPHYFRFDRQDQAQFATANDITHRANDVYKFTLKNNIDLEMTNETTGETITAKQNAPASTFPEYPIALFAVMTGTTASTFMSGRIYDWKYWNDGKLVQHLIPAQRLSDNAIGMFDKITNTFFENKGTGVFVAGNETKPMMPFWKRYPDVPSQYEVKEYLESDGYAQIDSGIRFTQGDKIDMVGRFINPQHDDGLICMTPWNQGSNSRFMFAVATQGGSRVESFCMAYNTHPGGENRVSPYFAPDTEYHRWTYDNLTLTIDDGVSSLTNTEVYPDDSRITGTIYLFRRFSDACKVAIKYYNHWRNGQLIASYVPVMRKSDGALGMYDMVSDKFLENVGTGSFTAG